MSDIRSARRILVLGCSGSGKSTLTGRLADALDLPAIHLDTHFWHENWTPSDRPAWNETVNELVARESWVMDGNFNNSLEDRLPRADFLVLMPFPRLRCLWRVTRRWLTWRNRTRPDMAEGCFEKVDFEFYRWIWNFYRDEWPVTLMKIRAICPDIPRVVLPNDRQAGRFWAG